MWRQTITLSISKTDGYVEINPIIIWHDEAQIRKMMLFIKLYKKVLPQQYSPKAGSKIIRNNASVYNQLWYCRMVICTSNTKKLVLSHTHTHNMHLINACVSQKETERWRQESDHTGKFLAKYNKFSSDIKPPPLWQYAICQFYGPKVKSNIP